MTYGERQRRRWSNRIALCLFASVASPRSSREDQGAPSQQRRRRRWSSFLRRLSAFSDSNAGRSSLFAYPRNRAAAHYTTCCARALWICCSTPASGKAVRHPARPGFWAIQRRSSCVIAQQRDSVFILVETGSDDLPINYCIRFTSPLDLLFHFGVRQLH